MPNALNICLSVENGQKKFQKCAFLNPLNGLIPKIPFSFFADSWVWVTSGAPVVSLGKNFLGGCQLSPAGGGTSSQRAVSTPAPPIAKGAVTRVVCPLGPPAYVDSSTATRVNNPGRPGGRATLSVPRGPSNRAANPLWDATQP